MAESRGRRPGRPALRRGGLAVLVALGALTASGSALAASPGSPDAGFGSHGVAALGGGIQSFGVAALPDGTSVVAGDYDGHAVAERLSAGGSVIDKWIGPGGSARAVAYDRADGDVVVAGTAESALFVERLSTSLRPDRSFGHGGEATVFPNSGAQANAVGVSGSGNVVAAGQAGGNNSSYAAAVSFSSKGAVQWSHVLSYGLNSVINAVAVQSNGAVVLAGSERPLQVQYGLLARLTSAGNADHSFHGSGSFAYGYPASGLTTFNALTLQGSNIIAAGSAAEGPTTIVARLGSNGQLDGSFGHGGVATAPAGEAVTEQNYAIGAYGVGIAKGGVIVAAGSYEFTGAEVDEALWAFTSGGGTDTGFGNGGTELSPQGEYEACGLSVLPDGNLVTAGDSTGLPDALPCTVRSGTSGFAAEFTGFGPISSTKVPTLKASVTGLKRSYGKSSAHRKGISFSVKCNEACTAVVLVKKGKQNVQKARVTLTKSGSKKVTLKTREFKKDVNGRGTVKLSLSVAVTSTGSGKKTTIRKTLTFR